MTRGIGWGRFLVTAMAAVLVTLIVVLALAWSALPLEQTTITIDGESVALSGLDGWHGAIIIVAGAVAVLLGLVVAVLAVVVALGAAALGVAIALAAVLTVLALVGSPLVFLGWLVWLAVRPARARAIAA